MIFFMLSFLYSLCKINNYLIWKLLDKSLKKIQIFAIFDIDKYTTIAYNTNIKIRSEKMNTIRLKDICIFKCNKQDSNGVNYIEYDLATSQELGSNTYNFIMFTGDKAGVVYSNVKLNERSDGKRTPAYKFDNFEQSHVIMEGVNKRYLQDVIGDALVSEQKYFALNNVYDVEKIKVIMSKLNKKLYIRAVESSNQATM